jgi:tetratricopeptide (TPR) repeat protein
VEIEEDPEVLSGLADAARTAGDGEVEERALERLSRRTPSADRWRRVADIRMEAKDYTGAERAYQRVLDGMPRDEAANLGMGRLHLARGDSLKAVECLRAAGPAGQVELSPLQRRLNLEKLSRPDLGALQKAAQVLVDRTYRSRLADSPSLSGNLRIRVTVDGSGVAGPVEVLEDTVHDDDVRACAYWNLRDATYPAEEPGRYSFTFTFKR